MDSVFDNYKGPQKYIANLAFISSSSSVKTSNPNFISVDLNKGSWGKYIYALKEWTSTPADAITGFAFVQNKQVVPMGFVKMEQNLNEGAKGT